MTVGDVADHFLVLAMVEPEHAPTIFIVDKDTVIDAGKNGNDARFINHECKGNCESVIVNRRVFCEATRDFAPGEPSSGDRVLPCGQSFGN